MNDLSMIASNFATAVLLNKLKIQLKTMSECGIDDNSLTIQYYKEFANGVELVVNGGTSKSTVPKPHDPIERNC